ncbi:MAG: sugar ABC transporter permease, partial [Chloroflexi bacterium]|nr:sugar ABC transporter permease [Chloroflexota bacterium]
PHLTWLSTLPWAQFAIVIVDVWQQVPFVGIVLLAGLQAIPDEYYEAARIDGGNAWRLFRSITLPLLRPAILVAGVILTTNAVRMFDLSYALTLGGPYASTETLSFFAFDRAFQAFDLPLAAAVSWFVFAVNLVITFIFVRVLHVRIDL